MSGNVYKYTLCFIQRGDEILMLNRRSKPEMGVWNGVGGKLEKDERPVLGIIREIAEETGIRLDREQVVLAGRITWVTPTMRSGMYVFLARVGDDLDYVTPRVTDEGILDWKPIAWILEPLNKGISHKIQHFLPPMLEGAMYDHIYDYDSGDNDIGYTRLPLGESAGEPMQATK